MSVLDLKTLHVDELKWESADAFTLELYPEEGETVPAFQAGQWFYLHVLNADRTSKVRVALSAASAPEEASGRLEFGVKVFGDKSKALSQLIPGDVVGIQGPFGVFVPKEQAEYQVFFAAGIGITPFRSMIKSWFLRKHPVHVVLFYSAKTVEEMVYFEEFEQLAKDWPAFTPVFTLTAPGVPAKWTYETGRVNAAMVNRYLRDVSRAEFYMCGPEGFMQSVTELLQGMGVDTKAKLHKELFG